MMGIFWSKKKQISELREENKRLKKRVDVLENLCDEKDEHFKGLMSDGLKHKSSLAAKYMADRKKYLKDLRGE